MKSALPEVRVLLTLDTEEDNWNPAREGITVENIRQLVPWSRFLAGLGVRPTYFVTYQVLLVDWALDVLREVSGDGQAEIGAHLHPWNTPPLDEAFVPRHWMLNNLPGRLQRAKLEHLTRAFAERLGHRPRSFRAGRFGLGSDLVGELARCGYEVDSSVTPFLDWRPYDQGPNFRGAPMDVYRIAPGVDPRVPISAGSVIEVPLSVGYTRLSPARWTRLDHLMGRSGVRRLHLAGIAARLRLVNKTILSPESESVSDMVALTRRLLASGARHLHVFFHSTSLIPGLSPFARTKADVDRIRARVAEYLERLERLAHPRFVTVSETAEALAPGPATVEAPMPAAAPPRLVSASSTPPRRLLVISYHYPPDGAVGGLRWAGLTKYLAELGWESCVLTAASGASGGRPGVSVVSCAALPTVNDAYLALASRVRRRLENGGRGAVPALAAPLRHTLRGRLLGAIRMEGGALLAFPDEARGWILAAARRARRIIREFGPDVVVSSGPPHSAHLVGALATRGTGVRWLADLRDPWAGPMTAAWRDHGMQRTLIGRSAAVRLERYALRRATGVVVNTRELRDALRALYPTLAIEWVPNGVDPERLPPAVEPPHPGMSIAYLGTLYGDRDLGPAMRAFRAFLEAHPAARADGSALRVAGRVEGKRAQAFYQKVRDLGLGDAVVHLGMLSPAEALGLLGRSRLALVLAQGQELQIPAKLYESVGLGVPTLVVAEPDSAAGREAERLGAHLARSDDVAGMARLFETLWQSPVAPRGVPEAIDYRTIARAVDQILIGG